MSQLFDDSMHRVCPGYRLFQGHRWSQSMKWPALADYLKYNVKIRSGIDHNSTPASWVVATWLQSGRIWERSQAQGGVS
jgi:hypothetical protein